MRQRSKQDEVEGLMKGAGKAGADTAWSELKEMAAKRKARCQQKKE